MQTRPSRRWILTYTITLAALTGLAIWADLRLSSFRDPPLDFYAMQPGEYYETGGLTRRQGGNLKLGFAEDMRPPPIGAFGNHIINYFGSEAFGEPEQPEVFFNYSYANVSLPEILLYLRHLEARDRLPPKLIIVSVTPPNADNGRFIINHGNELPPDLMIEDALRSEDALDAGDLAAAAWRLVEIRVHEVFNYNTLILGLSGTEKRERRTGPSACASRPTPARWFDRLPWTLRTTIGPYVANNPCEDWAWTLRRDGSTNPPTELTQVVNENDLGDDDRGLSAGDEQEIARYLQAIDAMGRRNGVKVVFLVTPVLETDRRDSIVNQVFDRALALTPEIEVIDDRGLHDDPTLIFDYLHPTPHYYRHVAQEIRRRGLLDESASGATRR